MFIGHFAAALLAKKAAPSVSLGVLFAAAQWLDLLWPALLLAGVEHAEVTTAPDAPVPLRFTFYPFSHSLLAVLGWVVLAGALAWWWRRSRRVALVVAALVASHWLLDLLVHVPDLPLAFSGGPFFGLGLWHWPLLALGVELGVFLLGVVVYRSVVARHGGGRPWVFAALGVFLVAIQLGNTFGPPPPGIAPVAWSGMATWLLVAWGWWADGGAVRERPTGSDSA
ncbi:hypothetical protein O4H66_24665 [Comamonadaceae bacterium G21597-S1]|nr:hypothetical protein [Comamonadaceae bacterium G21597-S1]